MSELVCNYCGNIQEEIKIVGCYSMKRIDGIPFIRFKNSDWEEDTRLKCKRCGKQIEKKIDYNKINFISVERNDPNHANYWKNGKTHSEIASVLAGETNPY